MDIECTQANLAKALHLVSRMVGTRGTLPVLGNILLSTDEGRLKLAATDLEVGIQTWIGGRVTAEGAITVPARLFVDFVTTNTDQKIRLSVKDTTLTLKSDRFSANINGIPASEFPGIPEVKQENPLTFEAKALREAISQTVFATAIDETRPVLTGVYLKIEDMTAKFAATDSYRLAEKTLPLREKSATLSVIIPSRTLQELNRMLGDSADTVEVYIADNQILFVFNDTVFISRLIDGTFPDYMQIIPPKEKITTKIDLKKDEFSQVMKMASFFARESANNVRMKVGSDSIEVTAISPQLGDTLSTLSGAITGEPVEIAFNAKFILDGLAVFPTEVIQVDLAGKHQPGILRATGKGDYFYLIMPLRIDG